MTFLKSTARTRRIRVYALAAVPFLAFFGYQLLVVLPHRPQTPDAVHGYTFPLGIDEGPARYISALDCWLTFGSFVCAGLIIGIGLLRSGPWARRA